MEYAMKNIFLIIVLLLFASCENFVDRPKDLLSQSKMAEIMADMAINDQATSFNTNANLELGTRFILKKHNIKAENFSTSYKYYIVNKKIPKIALEAQDIIKQKHPEAEDYINKKNKIDSSAVPISR